MRVSIIIPVYNGEKYLYQTILSCMKQDYNEIEIIVIDDHSSDNSISIINKFKKNNIKILKNKKNLGLARSVNIGVRFCSGEVIIVLGQDDILHHDHVSSRIHFFYNNKVVLVHGVSIVIDSSGDKIKSFSIPGRKLLFKNIFFNHYISLYNYISSCGLMFSKKQFLDVGGWDETFLNYGEWLLWYKISCTGNRGA